MAANKSARKKPVSKKRTVTGRPPQTARPASVPDAAQQTRQMVTDFRLVQTPELWGILLQARTPAGLLVPQFVPHDPNSPIPIEAGLQLPPDALQMMMDQLWSKGIRPTGMKIVVEEGPKAETLVATAPMTSPEQSGSQ